MAGTRDSAATITALLAVARQEFTANGYLDARTEAIVQAGSLTRGALYHHFRDKAALFEAVVEELQAEIVAAVDEAARGRSTPSAALRAGFAAYLDCCTRPDVRRIVLVDGPAALGWDRWREIDERHAFRSTARAVEACVAAGELVAVDPEAMARVLLGMITQVGLEIGRAEQPECRRQQLGDAIDVVLDRLRPA